MPMVATKTQLLASAAVLLFGFAGCGDHIGWDASQDAPVLDVGSDVPADRVPADVRDVQPIDASDASPMDVAVDVGADVPIDVRTETGSDAVLDARDGSIETGSDTGTDAGVDSRPDAVTDAGVDVATDTRVDAAAPWRHTITIDGTNDFTAASEAFTTTSATYTAYVTWDANYLYVGYNGADVSSGSSTKWVLVFFDVNPGTASGATLSPTYNTETVGFPTGFRPEFYLRWRASNDFQTIEQYTGSAWSTSSATPTTFQNGNYVEFRIPLAALGSPSSVGVTSLMLNETPTLEAAYAGLYSGNFTDGYHTTIPVTAYLLADFTSPLAPNSASNRH